MKQISVLVENKKGKLYEVVSALAAAGINLCALSIADTADYGILRIVPNDVDQAIAVLTGKGFLAKVTDVLAVKIDDTPSAFADIIRALADQDVSVEYTSAYTSSTPGTALMVLRVDKTDVAMQTLRNLGKIIQ